MVQLDPTSEHPLERDRPLQAHLIIRRGRVLEIAQLMRQADLMCHRWRGQLGLGEVRDPDLRFGPGQKRLDHLGATGGRDQVVAGGRGLEHPLPGFRPFTRARVSSEPWTGLARTSAAIAS